ncbi:S41 family peptidase [Inediibacterium massiliense]|uniref:S41 family peptidase n=1 Tax=Inediibacterium massiliense TaxID=1658111 RepID=UPI0006B61F78|nr:S41 family peptidase [Inediibacterium massiliense]
MLQRRKRTLLILTLIFSLVCTSVTYGQEPVKKFHNLDERIEYLKVMISCIEEFYHGDVTEEQLMEGAYKGLFLYLDDHSGYMNQREYEEFNKESLGVYAGIGAVVSVKEGRLVIVEPMENSPAQGAGLKFGDSILSINGHNMEGMTLKEATNYLLGDANTTIYLIIEREGKKQEVTLTRDIVQVNPTTSKILDHQIGYIKINEFNQNASQNVKKDLEEFNTKSIKKIILDLRDNPGGLLQEGVAVADFFTPKNNPIVYIKFKGEEETITGIKDPQNVKLVVLVNENTASAAEIVTGAIQDDKVGTIVGNTTYGKGTVQQTVPLDYGGAIKLTMAEYLTAHKRSIDKVGINPDILVEDMRLDPDLLNYLAPMLEDHEYTLNEKGLNVYGAQQRLNFLGKKEIKLTAILDVNTQESIKKFQRENGITENGVLTLETRDKIQQKTEEMWKKDLQLEKAIEILK